MQNEFGGLARTATDDANEGVIYKPQNNSVVARGQNNTKQLTRDTQLDEAVDDFATNFGKLTRVIRGKVTAVLPIVWCSSNFKQQYL